MLVEEELARFSRGKDTLLTVGVFDGVHLGHRHLISRLVEQARQCNLLPGVVTFRQHPQEVLSDTKLPFLTDLEERIRLIKETGVEFIIPLSFSPELSHLTPRQFVHLLKEYLRMRGLVIGPDFALGRNREGSVETLIALGKEMGFTVAIVSPMIINGEVVSSTAIREALVRGNMKKVAKMVGRPFSLQASVVTGAGRGVKLGFPTANLRISPEQAIPADGVYASLTYINGRAYPSMTYIGKSPTFGGKERGIEVYVLDYKSILYGRELKIDIIERLRGDIKFKSAEELKQQIASDVERGKAILESQGTSQA